MSKIDWSKPIETIEGHPARLVTVLKSSDSPYVVIVTDSHGEESACSISEIAGLLSHFSNYVRNVPEAPAIALKLYGGPMHPWTITKGSLDTHVIELTHEDLKRVMRPIIKP